jgi:hypothetical protein
VLIELRDRGGTDYIALPIDGVYDAAYMVTFVTDRPGGFTDSELTDLARVGQRLSIITDRHNHGGSPTICCAPISAPIPGPKF